MRTEARLGEGLVKEPAAKAEKPVDGYGWGPVAPAVFKTVEALTRLEGSTPSHSRQFSSLDLQDPGLKIGEARAPLRNPNEVFALFVPSACFTGV